MYLSVKNTFPVDLETLRNKKNPVALKTEKNNEHRSRNLAKNPNVPSSQEDHITQVSEEIEGRVTTKLSQKSSRTENRILGALARLGDFLMNPLIQGHSGTPPKTSRNAFSTSQGTNEDDSQSDPHPEAGIFRNQTTQNSDPEDGHDSYTFLLPIIWEHCTVNNEKQECTFHTFSSQKTDLSVIFFSVTLFFHPIFKTFAQWKTQNWARTRQKEGVFDL